jgi:hypothetical protein
MELKATESRPLPRMRLRRIRPRLPRMRVVRVVEDEIDIVQQWLKRARGCGARHAASSPKVDESPRVEIRDLPRDPPTTVA